MRAEILDGRKVAAQVKAALKEEVTQLKGRGLTPGLAVILVGDDPASQVYVGNKEKACRAVGIASFPHRLPAATGEEHLLQLIGRLNADPAVHGILVQLPLPRQLDANRVIQAIDPAKDVDGFHPVNAGRLAAGLPAFVPCTPQGVMHLLAAYNIPVAGRHAVVVGRSNIVGKPLVQLLLAADATVTVCHSKTRDLAAFTRTADILVAAVGRPRLITRDMVKPGAVVVDVGINRLPEGLVGDVDFEAVREVARYITPVPGGVGPLTIAMLLKNTLAAALAGRGGGPRGE
ncbi:bifunctional methylenetetrahydrofolate dehydrogenase/methenyltetrahydrofolate cyclohydrolase FolD [Gelria sp. Kuro-4]|uniref:bifunctional methylenetetrahydrofolate dehydrogenase/methenyltetrahydrofolate cyclohydrolase FolD n=1 Tax=Gelria sp. Kuro-4 TaxID=2796927 RepID=UPI001BEF2D5A|nr:bifunctional methylenetetrahydrofolate dehydrogenase/methenyltetrahydrofolate cyclohydrolase FolD [Gelria sp. Kuro-4]BCV24479.1 bifunctional protein FolD [Gelria sp. Kuro-4]